VDCRVGVPKGSSAGAPPPDRGDRGVGASVICSPAVALACHFPIFPALAMSYNRLFGDERSGTTMAELKTRRTEASVDSFLQRIGAMPAVRIVRPCFGSWRATRTEPKMWG
jgi:hypothetical protein